MMGTSSAARASLTGSSRAWGERKKRQEKEGRTVIHCEATEEGEDILDGLLRGDIVEVSGKSVGDEDAVESGLAAGVEIDLLEGGEAVVVDGEVDGKVGWRGEGIVSVGHCN